MKICKECGTLYDDELNFCAQCGSALEAVQYSDEENLNEAVEEASYENETDEALNWKEKMQNIASNVSDNEYVNSLKHDLQQSQTLTKLKEDAKRATEKASEITQNGAKQVKSTPSSTKAIIVATLSLIIVIVGLAIGVNTHRCDSCDKLYVGEPHVILGSAVCEDCFDGYLDYFD